MWLTAEFAKPYAKGAERLAQNVSSGANFTVKGNKPVANSGYNLLPFRASGRA